MVSGLISGDGIVQVEIGSTWCAEGYDEDTWSKPISLRRVLGRTARVEYCGPFGPLCILWASALCVFAFCGPLFLWAFGLYLFCSGFGPGLGPNKYQFGKKRKTEKEKERITLFLKTC